MIPLPAVLLLLAFALLIGFLAGSHMEDTPKPVLATCCFRPLSEWFINPAAGMICIVCKRTHPFLTHQEFRDSQRDDKEGSK